MGSSRYSRICKYMLDKAATNWLIDEQASDTFFHINSRSSHLTCLSHILCLVRFVFFPSIAFHHHSLQLYTQSNEMYVIKVMFDWWCLVEKAARNLWSDCCFVLAVVLGTCSVAMKWVDYWGGGSCLSILSSTHTFLVTFNFITF